MTPLLGNLPGQQFDPDPTAPEFIGKDFTVADAIGDDQRRPGIRLLDRFADVLDNLEISPLVAGQGPDQGLVVAAIAEGERCFPLYQSRLENGPGCLQLPLSTL